MKINIFGSTGSIGEKSLSILKKFYPEVEINLLVANKNYKKLIFQINKFKPKYVYLDDNKKYEKLKSSLKNNNVFLLNKNELILHLKKSKSDLTILSVSGIHSLFYFKYIIDNTKNLGLVSKECIVSSGHLFKKILKNKKINIYPLDSEHFSMHHYFKNLNNNPDYNKIYLTASGGPFLNRNISTFNTITLQQAINHPKWKMGYKNSIDSATMANKCLEVIEARYLFDIPYEKIDILIHPESLIHSIIELNNSTSQFNYFYNDMFIPIYNFLNLSIKSKNNQIMNNAFLLKKKFTLNFQDINLKRYPIYKLFLKMDKSNPTNIINFNCANEFAVELFKAQKINFNEIPKIINKCLSIDINSPVNTVKNIIEYNIKYSEKINEIIN